MNKYLFLYLFSRSLPQEIIIGLRAFCTRVRPHRTHTDQIKSFAAKPRIPTANSYLFFILLLGMGSSKVYAQSYNTAAGIRLGTDWGISLRQRLYENYSAELIVQSSLQREEGALTLLGIAHKPLLMRNLNLYGGGGLHAGWSSELKNGEAVPNPFGIDFIAGAELTLAKINISWDFKPAINLYGGNSVFYTQTGVSIRYVLSKREKYDWEKNKSGNSRRKQKGR